MPTRAKTIQQLAVMYSKQRSIRFSKDECEKLLKFYKKSLSDGKERWDRTNFRVVLHTHFGITDDIIMDRVFRSFDVDNDSAISMEEWLKGLSVYLKGTFDEKISFCFHVYDMNSDGVITREEMFQFLKTSIMKTTVEEEPDENTKELVEITLKKVDVDNDGRVSLQDYKTSVTSDHLLLELLGQCLPSDEHRLDFIAYLDRTNDCPTLLPDP